MEIYLVLCCAAAFFCVHLARNFFSRSASAIPGPFLARFSNLWRLYHTWRGDSEQTLYNLHCKYGDAVRIGPQVVSISNPEAIEKIYGLKTDFIKSNYFDVMTAVQNGEVIPTLVTTKDKTKHAALRRPITGAFAMSTLVKYEPYVDDVIKLFMTQLDERFASGFGDPTVCEMDKFVQYFAFDVTGELTFGRSFGFLKSGHDIEGQIGSIGEAFVYFGIAGQMPWIDWYLTKNPIITKYLPIKNPYIEAAIKKLKERFENTGSISLDNSRHDLLACFLDAQKNDPSRTTDEIILGYVMTMLLAGSDTSAVGLRAVVYYLAKHGEVRARLQAELDDANLSFPVTWKESQELPYLDAVIKEGLRIHPVGSVLQERVVPNDGLQLADGRRIGPGAVVGMSAWNVNRRADIFGRDAELYNPDRWLQQEHERHDDWKERLKLMKRADITFGHGTRSCIGKNLVYLEMYKLVATLFNAFEIELADPNKEWKTTSSTMVSQSEINVKIRWRKGNGLGCVEKQKT